MSAEVGIGLIGLGTVGAAVARRLVGDWELLARRAGVTPVLRRVAVRDPGRARDVELPNIRVDGDAEALVDDPAITVVVELMGGVDRATTLIERALRAGKHVVTANKAAIAAHGVELAGLAAATGVWLRFEAAAGAGIPAVAMLRDSLRGDRVDSLAMIINGTTNVILSRMEAEGATFADALADAQRRGFAEADPSADVDGHDAAAKLVLLGRLAFETPLKTDDVAVTGIRDVTADDIACARELGGSVKLVASARRAGDGVCLAVRPTVALAGHPLYGVDGAENAVLINADLAGAVLLRGPGAGGDSTASAVVSDIVNVLRTAPPPPPPMVTVAAVDDAEVEVGGYIRLRLNEVPEAGALVVQALEDRGVPVLASTSHEGGQLAILTGVVPREMLARAADTLDSLAAVAAVASVMDCLAA
jgi:homoserine dehydrogenase